MACHGDRGQGLTDEWRQAWDPPDRDCWQSGCHNPHHPPDGFVFPKVVPAVVGAGLLDQFQTAANLHAFIKSRMPFQAPGSLKDDEYWQLTAYLLRLNGYSVPFSLLDEQTAQRIPLVSQPVPASPKPVYIPLAVAILSIVFLVVLIIIFTRLRKRSRQEN